MVFEKTSKNLPWEMVLKFDKRRRQLLVDLRRGAGTCYIRESFGQRLHAG